MKQWKTLLLGHGLLFLTLATGTQAHAFGGGSSIGPANPASVFCEDLGGELTIAKDPNGGEYGICNIEEWSLFRQMSARGLVKPHRYPGVGMPNPASVNCEDIGGQLTIKESERGQYGICQVEEWTLWRVFNTKK
jgi:putative hemolysin